MEILFYRRKTLSKGKSTCVLYCRVTVEGERANIGSTNIKIEHDEFDSESQKVVNNYNAAEFNFILEHEFKSRLYSIYNNLLLKKEPITARRIAELFNQNIKDPIRLIDVFDRFLKDFEEQTVDRTNSKKEIIKARRSPSTLRPLTVCRNKLLKFLISKKQVDLTCDDLDERFFFQFEKYLFKVPHKQPTVVKHLRTLKQVTKFAKREKLIDQDPFAELEVEPEQIQDPKYLNQEQLLFWLHFEFSSPKAQEAADFFSLCCLTGFHYIDLVQVVKNPKEYLRKGLDGKIWLYKPRQKTKIMAKVPVSYFNAIERVVNKYGGWEHVPVKQNHHLNAWLKICAAEINLHLPEGQKIYEKLSVKHGRCTFTDSWYNVLGKETAALLPILGRKTSWGLDRYGKADERAVIKALEKKVG